MLEKKNALLGHEKQLLEEQLGITGGLENEVRPPRRLDGGLENEAFAILTHCL